MENEITRHRRTGGSANSDITIEALPCVGPNGNEYDAVERRNDGQCHRYRIALHSDEVSAPTVKFLQFQDGPPSEVGINGVTEEALIAVLIDRLERFNEGPYRCRQNSVAITKLEEALMWLGDRTAERSERGVEGTLKP